MNNLEKHQGIWHVYRNGELFDVVKNKITDLALNNLIAALYTTPVKMNIKYLAIGNSSTPDNGTAGKLGNEIFRTAFTTTPNKVSTGKVVSGFTILASEAIGTWEEIGLYGDGDSPHQATSTVDSGLLISRILWHHSKNSSEEFTFVRTDQIVRG
jgi:hypothetical protein